MALDRFGIRVFLISTSGITSRNDMGKVAAAAESTYYLCT